MKSFSGKRAFLSNFYTSPIEHEGITYPSMESYYQAQKTLDRETREYIATLSPQLSKKAGKLVEIRQDWEDVKLSVMLDGLTKKFAPGSPLAKQLLDTGDEYLEETNWWGDTFWGVCNGEGENNLGKLLMHVRLLLQS